MAITLLFGCRSNQIKDSKENLFIMTFYYLLCCLSVVLWPEEGDLPENLHPVVYVMINTRSFECFVCWDLILER